MNRQKYMDFLQTKTERTPAAGFEADVNDLNPALFDFQKHCVMKALQAGRFALFEECGMGKTMQQLEWCARICKRENAPTLIVAPLAVTGQTVGEAKRFGYDVDRLDVDNHDLSAKIYIVNYDRLNSVDAGLFAGVALDESSILKNFDGKMRNLIVDKFRHTRYKSCWTATPSPNDPMEIGNHAEFLGVMSRNEMLSMYFIHDGGNTSKWHLKGHAEGKFWRWVSSWAIMAGTPSDIGFSDEGYVLPKLNMIEEVIETPNRGNGMLFNDIAVNATNFNMELRMTAKPRLDRAAEIVNNSGESFIIWIRQDAEGEYLRRLIPDAVEVRGGDRPEIKEARLLGFGNNEFRVLITKAKIAQYGLNYQNCHNQIFASLDFSFESLYQAIRRSLRFMQKKPVNVWIITADTTQNVMQSIRRKQDQFNLMRASMKEAMRDANRMSGHKHQVAAMNIVLPSFLNKTIHI